jgi:hypothetical protein
MPDRSALGVLGKRLKIEGLKVADVKLSALG